MHLCGCGYSPLLISDKSACLLLSHHLSNDESRCPRSLPILWFSDSTVQRHHSHPKHIGFGKSNVSPRETVGRGKNTLRGVYSTFLFAFSRMGNGNQGPSLTRSKVRLAKVLDAAKEMQGRSPASLWSGPLNHTTAASDAQWWGYREHRDSELRSLCFAHVAFVQSVISYSWVYQSAVCALAWLHHVFILFTPPSLSQVSRRKVGSQGPVPSTLIFLGSTLLRCTRLVAANIYLGMQKASEQ